jgi:hypothetical protein
MRYDRIRAGVTSRVSKFVPRIDASEVIVASAGFNIERRGIKPTGRA